MLMRREMTAKTGFVLGSLVMRLERSRLHFDADCGKIAVRYASIQIGRGEDIHGEMR
jgi:hypothetical protein